MISSPSARISFELVGEYRDEGVSGTRDLNGWERLSELLTRILANGACVVIVEWADRLARDLLVSEVILGQFRDLGVRVIAADGGTDLTAGDDDPTRVADLAGPGRCVAVRESRDRFEAKGCPAA